MFILYSPVNTKIEHKCQNTFDVLECLEFFEKKIINRKQTTTNKMCIYNYCKFHNSYFVICVKCVIWVILYIWYILYYTCRSLIIYMYIYVYICYIYGIYKVCCAS